MNKAVFVDLDGTLIKTDSGRTFPIHSGDWKLIPETLEALKHFYKGGYKIIIVSNQEGIEQGYLTEILFIRKVETICTTVEKLLKLKKGSIAYSYCKNMVSYNRKPNTGMAYDNALEFELSLKDSVMLGDFESDEEFAINAGIGEYIDITKIIVTDWNK